MRAWILIALVITAQASLANGFDFKKHSSQQVTSSPGVKPLVLPRFPNDFSNGVKRTTFTSDKVMFFCRDHYGRMFREDQIGYKDCIYQTRQPKDSPYAPPSSSRVLAVQF